MPHADYLDQWDRRRELADPRPCTLPTRAPFGMLGAWAAPTSLAIVRGLSGLASEHNRGVEAARLVPDADLDRLDDLLARIHRGM